MNVGVQPSAVPRTGGTRYFDHTVGARSKKHKRPMSGKREKKRAQQREEERLRQHTVVLEQELELGVFLSSWSCFFCSTGRTHLSNPWAS